MPCVVSRHHPLVSCTHISMPCVVFPRPPVPRFVYSHFDAMRCFAALRLRPSKSAFSPSEMAHLKETAGVRGFLDDFIDCPDTVRQVRRYDRPTTVAAAVSSDIIVYHHHISYRWRGPPLFRIIRSFGRAGSQVLQPAPACSTRNFLQLKNMEACLTPKCFNNTRVWKPVSVPKVFTPQEHMGLPHSKFFTTQEHGPASLRSFNKTNARTRSLPHSKGLNGVIDGRLVHAPRTKSCAEKCGCW